LINSLSGLIGSRSKHILKAFGISLYFSSYCFKLFTTSLYKKERGMSENFTLPRFSKFTCMCDNTSADANFMVLAYWASMISPEPPFLFVSYRPSESTLVISAGSASNNFSTKTLTRSFLSLFLIYWTVSFFFSLELFARKVFSDLSLLSVEISSFLSIVEPGDFGAGVAWFLFHDR